MIDVVTTRFPGFRGEFLWELEIAARQTVAMAETIAPDKYDWRPDAKARSVSEVFVHVATGNFLLLDAIGTSAPTDLYMQVPTEGWERFSSLMRRNDELGATIRDKDAVVALLKRSLDAVHDSFHDVSDADLDRHLYFFGEETTVRRVYLRLLTHTHEHMGQMIAYLRFSGIAIPWPDWRPDRRTQSSTTS
jgi:uncharacterized damage-inducible protein DinB